MKKRILTAIITALTLMALTGCAMFESAIPEMSEEEQDLVVEYAAETLLRYDVKGGGRLKHISEEVRHPQAEIVGEPEEAPEPTPQPESMTVVDNPEADNPVEVVDNTGSGGNVFTDLATAIGYSGQLEFTYNGYEICDYYPEDIGNYFVMNAQSGYRLLVIKYQVRNLTGSDLAVTMPYGSVRYKVTMNGTEKNALTTLLLNDLSSYRGTIAAGESTELVIVTEYTDRELASGVGSLTLGVKAPAGSGEVSLQ